MTEFEIGKLLPRFIMDDVNGRALAKALEAGLKYFCECLSAGVDALSNPDTMPEWRLDELAWEYNIPYDYGADESVKRDWIRNVYSLSKLYGTPEGIIRYLAGYFDGAVVKEFFEYGGQPFHFRVDLPGGWSPEDLAWAEKAVNSVKNTRSVQDGYTFVFDWYQVLFKGCGTYNAVSAEHSVDGVDMTQITWLTDENGDMLLDENGLVFTEDET